MVVATASTRCLVNLPNRRCCRRRCHFEAGQPERLGYVVGILVGILESRDFAILRIADHQGDPSIGRRVEGRKGRYEEDRDKPAKPEHGNCLNSLPDDHKPPGCGIKVR
ncbi:hypothetical protein NKH19_03325 [Mesorhizobium sp. M1338]|uniref:hypothetical protein n=1 Tax=Mesorhizobium sp. M1338 TaxID=2957085 RepID=UPI003336FF4B